MTLSINVSNIPSCRLHRPSSRLGNGYQVIPPWRASILSRAALSETFWSRWHAPVFCWNLSASFRSLLRDAETRRWSQRSTRSARRTERPAPAAQTPKPREVSPRTTPPLHASRVEPSPSCCPANDSARSPPAATTNDVFLTTLCYCKAQYILTLNLRLTRHFMSYNSCRKITVS